MIYNLKTDKESIISNIQKLYEYGSIFKFIKNGKNKIIHDNIIILVDYTNCYFIKNNIIYGKYIDKYENTIQKSLKSKVFHQDEIVGIILPQKITKNKNAFDILINADLDDRGYINNLLQIFKSTNYPTLSFNCLSKFYKNNILTALNNIINNRLKIIDYNPDIVKNLTDNQKKILSDYQKSKLKDKVLQLKPPNPGFTLINDSEWHCPATVLLKESKQNGMHILFGQDEETYFGVELKGKPKTVNEAFQDLIPIEIRNKKGVERQGEWFVVPVKEKDFPKINNFASFIDDQGGLALALHRDSENQSLHILSASYGGVTKEGKIFAKGNISLSHSNDDHEEIYIQGMYTFVKNTAKRSFSEKGVD